MRRSIHKAMPLHGQDHKKFKTTQSVKLKQLEIKKKNKNNSKHFLSVVYGKHMHIS